jgi:hypothetical protein
MDRDWRGVEIISVEGAILLALALIAYGIQLIRKKTSQGKGLSNSLSTSCCAETAAPEGAFPL